MPCHVFFLHSPLSLLRMWLCSRLRYAKCMMRGSEYNQSKWIRVPPFFNMEDNALSASVVACFGRARAHLLPFGFSFVRA